MKRQINVFIGSPGDLASERKVFRKVIEELNRDFSDGADVDFVALGWEDTLAFTGRRNQSVINEDVDKCDVFVLTMHRRWGQPAPDAAPYSSYTEEEFHRALERWRTGGKPEIFVFFKKVDPASEADAGPQLQKVLEFRRHLEETRQLMYKTFEDEDGFATLVKEHLKAFAKGKRPKTLANSCMVVLPLAALEEIQRARLEIEFQRKSAENAHNEVLKARLKIEELHLTQAQDAAALSQEGKIEFARQKFIKLLAESSNKSVLCLAFEFFLRTSDLHSAQSSMENLLINCEQDTLDRGCALFNLGQVYLLRGDLESANGMLTDALSINKKLGLKKGLADCLGTIGILHQSKGDLGSANQFYLNALKLYEEIDDKKGIANQYNSLGDMSRIQCNLDLAVEYLQKALLNS